MSNYNIEVLLVDREKMIVDYHFSFTVSEVASKGTDLVLERLIYQGIYILGTGIYTYLFVLPPSLDSKTLGSSYFDLT